MPYGHLKIAVQQYLLLAPSVHPDILPTAQCGTAISPARSVCPPGHTAYHQLILSTLLEPLLIYRIKQHGTHETRFSCKNEISFYPTHFYIFSILSVTEWQHYDGALGSKHVATKSAIGFIWFRLFLLTDLTRS
jgi:hypothetical protein